MHRILSRRVNLCFLERTPRIGVKGNHEDHPPTFGCPFDDPNRPIAQMQPLA